MGTEIKKLEFETPQELVLLKASNPSKAEKIEQAFAPMVAMLKGFEEEYEQIIEESKSEVTKELTQRAKMCRLKIVKIRTQTGKLKDEQKEYLKLEDKAIMGTHNILVWAVKEKEDKLVEVEKHFEILEQKRQEALQTTRQEELSKYVDDPQHIALGTMEEDVWNAYIDAKKRDFEIRTKAAKEAEEARVKKEAEEAAERECIRLEIEQLKAQAEKDRIANEAAQKKRDAEQAKLQAKVDAEKKALQAKLDAAEKAQKDAEAAQKKKDDEAAALKKKLEDAEATRIAKEEADRQTELSKGDMALIDDLLNDLNTIKTKYAGRFKADKYARLFKNTCDLIDKIITYIKEKK